MQAKTVEKVIKRSLLYSLVLSQPLAMNHVLAFPAEGISMFEEEDLQYGDHGELIRHLQLKLKKLGYYTDEVDGVYGLYTEQAVRQFQSSETISINGVIDEGTFNTLLNSEKKEAFNKINEELNAITFGDTGEAVVKVQEILYFYGYYRASIDGIYGPLTDSAIKQIVDEQLFSFTEQLDEQNNGEIKEQIEQATQLREQRLEEKETSTGKSEDKQAIKQVDVSKYNDSIISAATSFIGTPYVWGGSSPGGFDCSGFIQYVYGMQDVTIPRTVIEIWIFSVSVSSSSVGDLVFFETYQPGPSHLGIYLGAGNFVHAGSSRGVEISNLNDNTYCNSRYLGAKRIQ